MQETVSRKVPRDVARFLRAEAGFGCAVCGCPIIEYHHIIPWAERQHYELTHMVALCRNHHHEIAKQSKEKAYRAKANPINIRHKRLRGLLVTNKQSQALRLGNTRFVGFSSAVSYYEIPLFGYSLVDGEIRLNAFVPDGNFFAEIEVSDNDLIAMIDGFWDIEFKSNFVKFRRRKGENFLSMDFRSEDVEVRGRYEIDGRTYEFSPTRSDFGGYRIENLTLVGPPGIAAIMQGEPGKRLLRPNYAMRFPQAVLVRS